ncbi:MAG: hypothetical protein HYZ28_04820 [Myxococcales bacterium]|nr:hypothetical protein [Myxococcales bacterium]
MTPALLLSALLLASSTPSRGRAVALTKLEQGQRDFSRGDFQSALKALDAAAQETSDPAALSRVHLLRGQVSAAQQDFAGAEAAFALALESDPEAALDPSKVDPALVKLLDGLRARLTGELSVRADRPASVWLDGSLFGETPLLRQAPIGRRAVEVKTPDGRYGSRREVVVYAKRKSELELLLEELPQQKPKYEGTTPEESPRRPFADLRLSISPFALLAGPSLEVGGGFEFPFYRVSMHAQVYQDFGLTARAALVVPVLERKLNASVELELPVLFEQRLLSVGLGGGGGLEYVVSKWLGVFVQVGAQHFFITPRSEPNSTPLQLGARLRLP